MKIQLSPFASIIAWCLMPNHFHWVVYIQCDKIGITTLSKATGTGKKTINQSIGILLGSYTRAIQKQEGITGSLFQKRTKEQPLIDEVRIEPAYWQTIFGTQINISEGKSYLETCVEYVHKNPVYSGIVKNAEDWEFSSFPDYTGKRSGKLIDYELIKKESLLPENRHPNINRETTNTIIVGIGSNDDAEKNIPKMLKILAQKVRVVKVSSFLKTRPVGILDQPDFTNGAVKIETSLSRDKLTEILKSIEDQMGRDRSQPKFGPRCIDLDIVIWNGEVVDQDYYTRDFLRKTVNELSDI